MAILRGKPFGSAQGKEDEGYDPSYAKASGGKRRNEQAKPWGKKERLLVFFFFAATVLVSSVLALTARSWKLPGFPQLKVPSFNLPFSREETIIIERKVDQVAQVEQVEKGKEIVAVFKEKTKGLSGVYGLYVVNLDTGYSFGVNEDEIFEPASLNKLPVMAAIYMEEEKGNLDLETKYTLKSSDKLSGGSLYRKPAGHEITYRNLIRLMGKQSDNTAFNIARNLLGEEKINEAITKIGMKSTSLQENETTPVDIGIFFEELWHARLPAPERSDGGQGNIVSKESAEELLDYLTDTVYEAWLTEGVPADIRVAHKFGRELHVVNDAGIVFTDKPFVLVIMSKGVVEREADSIFPDLARIVFEAESK